MASGKVRIWGTVTPEVGQKIDMWSERLGIPKTYLISMAVQAGLNQIVRSISPEESIPPEILVKIVEAMRESGLEIDVEALKEAGKVE